MYSARFIAKVPISPLLSQQLLPRGFYNVLENRKLIDSANQGFYPEVPGADLKEIDKNMHIEGIDQKNAREKDLNLEESPNPSTILSTHRTIIQEKTSLWSKKFRGTRFFDVTCPENNVSISQ